ncbi:Pup--protein ligase [Corynebacterium sp. 3HC-13]|nr:Pup--protein ligase [Corynebacterium poyangense]
MGLETEYGIMCAATNGVRCLGPDEAARYLFRPIVEKYSSSNVFIRNASRLYLDVGAHPEVATAECDNLRQLLAHDRAGDATLTDLGFLAEQALAQEGVDAKIHLFRNNVDTIGNSYGCHENYLISRDVLLKNLGNRLMAFLITRQLVCGAGTLAPKNSGYPAGFCISQRADHVWEGVSSATTRARPMINTRDEPHADSSRFRRMHVIVGDSTMAEPTTALKIGSMLLMLEMMESGWPLPEWEVAQPSHHIRDIARDLSGQTPLVLKDGTTVSALEVQETYCQAASDYLRQRQPPAQGGTSQAELLKVVELWSRTLEALRKQDFSLVDQEIDWVIKYQLIRRYQERWNTEDPRDPRLINLDLRYHDIHPQRGLLRLLEQREVVKRWITEEEVLQAKDHAPDTTRAHLRGCFLQAAENCHAPVTVDWVRLKLDRPEPTMVELPDPFSAVDDKVDELIATMQDHSEQGVYS